MALAYGAPAEESVQVWVIPWSFQETVCPLMTAVVHAPSAVEVPSTVVVPVELGASETVLGVVKALKPPLAV